MLAAALHFVVGNSSIGSCRSLGNACNIAASEPPLRSIKAITLEMRDAQRSDLLRNLLCAWEEVGSDGFSLLPNERRSRPESHVWTSKVSFESLSAQRSNNVIQRVRYSLAEAAEALGISRSMVENIVRDHGLTIHADTPGGHRYISHFALEIYIREREEQPVFGRRKAGKS